MIFSDLQRSHVPFENRVGAGRASCCPIALRNLQRRSPSVFAIVMFDKTAKRYMYPLQISQRHYGIALVPAKQNYRQSSVVDPICVGQRVWVMTGGGDDDTMERQVCGLDISFLLPVHVVRILIIHQWPQFPRTSTQSSVCTGTCLIRQMLQGLLCWAEKQSHY